MNNQQTDKFVALCMQARQISVDTGYAYSDILELIAHDFRPEEVRKIVEACDKLDPICPGTGHLALRSCVRIMRGEIPFQIEMPA